MPDQPMQTLVRHIRRMAGDEQDSEQSDRVLLAKFIAQRDENAFAALVQKHGPMVRGVCQRLLGQSPDVDDAFQATFLILVRKASAIRKADSLASWLYGVAYRIARGLRNRIARRELLERQPLPRSVDDPGMQAAWRELCMLLDEEVQRLADKYRAPLVLCYLEGQTRDQAARQLGCSLRTLDRRLTEGRERLRTRLARRGLTLSAGLLAVAMGEHMATAAVPSGLADGTLQAAMLIFKGKRIATAATSQVAVLVQEGLRAMFWTKLQAFTVFAVVAAGVATTGLILYTGGAPAQDRHSGQRAELPEAAADALAGAARDENGGQAMRQRPDPRQSASERMRSQNNLKQIALAMHNYLDTYGHFPAPAIYSGSGAMMGGMMRGDMMGRSAGMGMVGGPPAAGSASGMPMGGGAPGGGGGPAPGLGAAGGGGGARGRSAPAGKALLSWRVALLPFLEQDALYRQFRLNEPWDSPHNKRLLAAMPKVYAPVGNAGKDGASSTFYQVFVGPHSVFQKHALARLEDIADGMSNTIMVAEAGRAVPWTKPEDLPFDLDEPLPELGGLFTDRLHVAMCDGSVHTLRPDPDEALLRAAITRDYGEVIDLNNLFVRPVGGGGSTGQADRAGLLEENKQLSDEYNRLQDLIEQLKAEVRKARNDQDKEAARLHEENRRLKQGVDRLHDEAEALTRELRQMKRTPPDRRKKD